MSKGPDSKNAADQPLGMLTPDPMAEIKAGFFQECEELLEQLTDGLEEMAAGTATPESFNSVFRAVHSIKGGAAAFSLNDLTDFAHGFETRLGMYREAGTIPTRSEVTALQTAADRLAALVALAGDGAILSDEARLADAALLNATSVEEDAHELRFRLSGQGNILRELLELGTVSTVLDEATVPTVETFDAQRSALCWDVKLTTALSGERLASALRSADPDGALAEQASTSLIAPEVDSSAATQAQSNQLQSQLPTATIRVGLDRIDKLINLVGELVINQAMLTRSAEELGAEANSDHVLGLEELMRLTRDLQDSVMQIRAQPVKPLFQRMARICREAAGASGKQVELVSEGQDTEIDKTVIERLSDPLTHMIRNAVDHAIETPSDRTIAGKSETGRITLRASHRSGQVILEVIDDGAGIDRDKVLRRARQKGLVAPETDLAPSDVDNLLFLPGFSTADEVSALSGRGVGMDVVRASVHALGGRITIHSEPGQSTRFEIALPLTLAVLDAMIVSVGGETLVLPLSTIHETITISENDVFTMGSTQRMLRYTGCAVTLVDLGEELGYYARQSSLDDRVALIIQAEGQPPVALAIDEIHEQRQVVIKGLQEGFAAASSVAAATILGDGQIALIIDPFDSSLSPGVGSPAHRTAVPLEMSA